MWPGRQLCPDAADFGEKEFQIGKPCAVVGDVHADCQLAIEPCGRGGRNALLLQPENSRCRDHFGRRSPRVAFVGCAARRGAQCHLCVCIDVLCIFHNFLFASFFLFFCVVVLIWQAMFCFFLFFFCCFCAIYIINLYL